MNHRTPWQALACLILGVSLIVLDGTIVSVSLPTIISDLNLSLTEAQWISSLYTVVFAALLLPAGTLGDRIGRKRIFIGGLALFALASLIAAMASGAGILIFARGLQGIGGAMVLPSTLSSINSIFRGKDRAIAFGLWGATMASMAAIGPLLGGWITTHLTWPWIFLVNIPLVAILIPCALKVVPENTGTKDKLDIGGAVLASSAFALIVFGLIEATTYGWFTPKKLPQLGPITWPDWISVTLASLIAGTILLVAFIVNQKKRVRAGKPVLLDVTLFAIPTFTRGNVAAMTVATGEFGILFALPLFLVNVLGLSTMGSGWVLAALALGSLLAGGGARHMAARFGPALTVVIGLGLEVIGISITALILSPTSSPATLALVLAVYGFGMGLASAQLASVVLANVPLDRSGMGSAAQSTFRQVGSAIGVALAGTALATAMNHDLPTRLANAGLPPQAIDPTVEATVSSAGGAMSQLARGNEGVLAVLHEGFSHGMTAVLLANGTFLLIGFIASLLLLKASRTSAEQAGARDAELSLRKR